MSCYSRIGRDMEIHAPVTVGLGIVLIIIGVVIFGQAGCPVPFIIGAALVYLGWRGGRVATLIFGHTLVVVGAYLIAWGLYLLPQSSPTLVGILTRPLFWGIISMMGGVCAIYHSFCRCIRIKD